MKIKIIYDNTVFVDGFAADWGFSCLVEAHGKRILFDTGAKGPVLLQNMARLGISPDSLDAVLSPTPTGTTPADWPSCPGSSH